LPRPRRRSCAGGRRRAGRDRRSRLWPQLSALLIAVANEDTSAWLSNVPQPCTSCGLDVPRFEGEGRLLPAQIDCPELQIVLRLALAEISPPSPRLINRVESVHRRCAAEGQTLSQTYFRQLRHHVLGVPVRPGFIMPPTGPLLVLAVRRRLLAIRGRVKNLTDRTR
jgi:hypothetical protein